MNQPADIATVAPSQTFEVTHYRMDKTNQRVVTYVAPEVTADMVTKIRAVSQAEKHGEPVIDATGEHFVPWLTKTCIETAGGNLYVQDELDSLARINPNDTPVESLPQTSQLIVAVQRTRPEIVQLPEIEIRKPEAAADATPPDGAPYTPYRPKRYRQSLLSRITPTQIVVCGGMLAAGTLALSGIIYENNQRDFWQSTECTDVSSMSSPNALIVGRPSENMKLRIDRQGRVFVSTQPFMDAKQTTKPIGKVTGDVINGYSVDISDSYRPGTGNAAAAVNVCVQRQHPTFK